MNKTNIALVVIYLSVVSCGSSNGGGSDAGTAADLLSVVPGSPDATVSTAGLDAGMPFACEAVVPCGGNLVGKWNINRTCFPPAFSGSTVFYQKSCLQDIQTQGTGTLEFREDGTYAMSVKPYFEFIYSASCLAGNGGSCATAATAYSTTAEPATYSEQGDVCKVDSFMSGDYDRSGSFKTFGPVLAESGEWSMFSNGGYCVHGDRLDFYRPSNLGLSTTFTAFRTTAAVPPETTSVDFKTPAPVGTSLFPCDAKAPCGGDLVGTWNTVNACDLSETLEVSSLYPLCSVGTTIDQNGSRTFNQDGSCAVQSNQTLDAKYSVKCLELIGKKCNDLDQELRVLAASAGAPPAGASLTVSCAAVDQYTCTCTLVTSAIAATCQYAVQGTTLTMVTSVGNQQPSTATQEYCVNGYDLMLVSEKTSHLWSIAVNQGVEFVKKR